MILLFLPSLIDCINERFSSMTVANALTIITFHVVSDANIMTKLQTELKTVMPRPDSRPKWNQLEHLPYLVSFPKQCYA